VEPVLQDSLTQELSAMSTLGKVLGELADPAARERVLRWATERFQAGEPVSRERAAEAVRPVAGDPMLAVDSLDDMFAPGQPVPHGGEHAVDHHTDADLTVYENETVKQPIEVVLRSFAAEFQRFAEEWNGASA
jgi:hypothetical protein